jgi:hypothetical protein
MVLICYAMISVHLRWQWYNNTIYTLSWKPRGDFTMPPRFFCRLRKERASGAGSGRPLAASVALGHILMIKDCLHVRGFPC